jgi:hypothetical protein
MCMCVCVCMYVGLSLSLGPSAYLPVCLCDGWQKLVRDHLETCNDALGLVLCIRVNGAHQRTMQARRVPALDPHLNELSLLLWPR